MAALWNPNHLLSIAGKAKPGELQCSATNTGDGHRCGWEKWSADPDNRAVQALLPSLAATPPEDVTLPQLLGLAELCLCRDKPTHASQKGKLAARWQTAIKKHVAAQPPKRPRTPEVQIRAQAAYPSPDSSFDSVASASPAFTFRAPVGEDDSQPDRELSLRAAAAAEELKKTQQELRVALAERNMFERDRAALMDVVSKQSIDHKAVQDEASELRSAMAAREKELVETRKRVRAAKMEADGLRMERDAARAELAGAEAKKQRLVGEIEALQSGVKAREEEVVEEQERARATKREADGLRVERDTARTNLTEAEEEKQRLVDGMEALQSAVKEREKEVVEARETARAAKREADGLRVQRDYAQTRFTGAEEQRQRMMGGMEALKENVAMLESDKEASGKQLREVRVELATEKTRVLTLLNRLAVEEKRDAGRELAPVKKTLSEDGWKNRVQSWMRRMGGTHAGKRPKVSRYDV